MNDRLDNLANSRPALSRRQWLQLQIIEMKCFEESCKNHPVMGPQTKAKVLSLEQAMAALKENDE